VTPTLQPDRSRLWAKIENFLRASQIRFTVRSTQQNGAISLKPPRRHSGIKLFQFVDRRICNCWPNLGLNRTENLIGTPPWKIPISTTLTQPPGLNLVAPRQQTCGFSSLRSLRGASRLSASAVIPSPTAGNAGLAGGNLHVRLHRILDARTSEEATSKRSPLFERLRSSCGFAIKSHG
jgi:hypothetical protein